jgi:hypothetical protein
LDEDPQQFVYQTDLADTMSHIGRIQIARGRRELALDALRHAIALRRRVSVLEELMLYNIACDLAVSVPLLASWERANAADEAMETLKHAVEHGYHDLDQFLVDRDDALASLRDRPGLAEVEMDLEFPLNPFTP